MHGVRKGAFNTRALRRTPTCGLTCFKKELGSDWPEQARSSTVTARQARTCLVEQCPAKLITSELLIVTVTQDEGGAKCLEMKIVDPSENYTWRRTSKTPNMVVGRLLAKFETPKHDATRCIYHSTRENWHSLTAVGIHVQMDTFPSCRLGTLRLQRCIFKL